LRSRSLMSENPPSPEMVHYIKSEGLSFGMGSPERYEKSLAKAGFSDIKLRDRNAWYSVLSREEYQQMKGPLYIQMETTLGREYADRYVEIWRAMNVVLESGELRPGHLRAIKSNVPQRCKSLRASESRRLRVKS